MNARMNPRYKMVVPSREGGYVVQGDRAQMVGVLEYQAKDYRDAGFKVAMINMQVAPDGKFLAESGSHDAFGIRVEWAGKGSYIMAEPVGEK